MIFSLQDGKHFYQWDRERVLIVNDSEIDQVHFTNDAITQAIVKDVYTVDGERLVDVPTALLQCACNLTAYAYKVETAEREYTLIHETFGVIARKKPNDYIPPEEHDKWETVRAEVLEALEQSKAAAAAAEADKEQAATSAQNAKDSETKAAQSASTAAAYIEGIEKNATAAEKAASEAKLSAENAASAASSAETSEAAARTSAEGAETSENNARSYSESAQQSAASALESKNAAKTSETNAATSEANAATSEANALESKNAAQNAANYAHNCWQVAETSSQNAQKASSNAQVAQEAAESARDEAVSAKESALSARIQVAEVANYAKDYKKESEAWAVGTVEGVAVDETSDQYQNNSKYYAEKSALSETAAGNSASAAAASENNAKTSADSAGNYANQAELYMSTSQTANSQAQAAKTAAVDAQAKAEAARDKAQEIVGGDYVTKTELESKGYLTEHQDISGKANVSDLTAHTGNSTIHVTADEKTAWNGKSNFSGNYNDLTNKPTIPTVPTKVSAFTNDAGYLTQHQDISGKANASDLTSHTGNTTVHITAAERTAWNAKSEFSGSYNDLKDKPTIPTIPTKVSAFTNDAGYLTQHQDISGKANASDLTAHTGNSEIHVTAAEKAAWNEKNNFIATYGTTTFDELLNAYNSGKTIIAKYNGNIYQLVSADTSLSFMFVSVVKNSEYVTYVECEFTGDWYFYNGKRLLPDAGTSNSGKILMVNSSGVPAWTAITNAEGVSY